MLYKFVQYYGDICIAKSKVLNSDLRFWVASYFFDDFKQHFNLQN
jgi:hypothetical protein